MIRRTTGILLHISSLPGAYGIGDFGKEAYHFADFLEAAGVFSWQVLPLNPTDLVMGNSPYSSSSAFALNPLLISPDELLKEGLLHNSDLEELPYFTYRKVDYKKVIRIKTTLLYKAWDNFVLQAKNDEFLSFCEKEKSWLEDFSIFQVLRNHFKGREWNQWPKEFRDRKESAMHKAILENADAVAREKFIQFMAHKQWFSLKEYCNQKGIQIIGDIPIYVQFNSADVWANQAIFKLDRKKRPTEVAGVPPDYFSETGQLWGNPVYDWHTLKKNDFSWWIDRMTINLKLFDRARIDHFRGLVAYWAVKAGEKTAINGEWIAVPVEQLFAAFRKKFKELPLIAEDLGMITPDVINFLEKTGFPGMRVLQFGFMGNDPDDAYLPHNYAHNTVAYTGTHDNNTLRGWYTKELTFHDHQRISNYLGKKTGISSVHKELVRLLIFSVADTVIFPLQDLFGAGHRARMNRPGKAKHNWEWRFTKEELKDSLSDWLYVINDLSGRIKPFFKDEMVNENKSEDQL
ncbi:MAG TPA: 4-alpha-glucanotransferase [Bacteroidales bacterium]|nr:4-alpha-glucanotransferase [Bacteroidales bacterium]